MPELLTNSLLRRAIGITNDEADRRIRALSTLSGPELDTAKLAAAGLTNKEIGRAMYVGEYTAKTRMQRIMLKLHVGSRSQVAATVYMAGCGPVPSDQSPIAALEQARFALLDQADRVLAVADVLRAARQSEGRD